jgi:hypothetical protein
MTTTAMTTEPECRPHCRSPGEYRMKKDKVPELVSHFGSAAQYL